MSASLSIKGVKPPTKEYLDKLNAYRACEAAGVPVPKEILDFFEDRNLNGVDPNGIEVGLTWSGSTSRHHASLKECSGERGWGFDVDLDKLPPGVKILRITLS